MFLEEIKTLTCGSLRWVVYKNVSWIEEHRGHSDFTVNVFALTIYETYVSYSIHDTYTKSNMYTMAIYIQNGTTIQLSSKWYKVIII